jgi:hypothetical protein
MYAIISHKTIDFFEKTPQMMALLCITEHYDVTIRYREREREREREK